MRRVILDWMPDYDIAENGEVRRITPAKTRGNIPYVVNGNTYRGYTRVKLMMPNGKKRCLSVHRLVCEAFHGAPPSRKHHAAHFDGDPQNNHYSNLRWATAKENVGDDRTRHNRHPAGERNGRSVLNWTLVKRIRSEFTGAYGEASRLARKYGLSNSAMRSVLTGEHWRDG